MSKIEFREEWERKYEIFLKNKLVFKSQPFGSNIIPNAVMPGTQPVQMCDARKNEVLEVRRTKDSYQVGCVRLVTFYKGQELVEQNVTWFDYYNDIITSLDEGIEFCRRFMNGYADAANEHQQAGIDYYVSETQKGR